MASPIGGITLRDYQVASLQQMFPVFPTGGFVGGKVPFKPLETFKYRLPPRTGKIVREATIVFDETVDVKWSAVDIAYGQDMELLRQQAASRMHRQIERQVYTVTINAADIDAQIKDKVMLKKIYEQIRASLGLKPSKGSKFPNGGHFVFQQVYPDMMNRKFGFGRLAVCNALVKLGINTWSKLDSLSTAQIETIKDSAQVGPKVFAGFATYMASRGVASFIGGQPSTPAVQVAAP